MSLMAEDAPVPPDFGGDVPKLAAWAVQNSKPVQRPKPWEKMSKPQVEDFLDFGDGHARFAPTYTRLTHG